METATMSKLVILDPTYDGDSRQGRMAPRPSELAGKTLGLLDNEKPNARELLDLVDGLLHDRIGAARVLRFRKPDSTRVAPGELIEDIARQCDYVITGVGD